ncbi:hypothetical protein KIN20_033456 [Parelaphostrongylus tenuis]|uniref:Uncharacterized protein n=1 Tax=Parelaphostrongylus tenuis TaxID=148309 RepID=A0AAD5R8M0_PARTN|nr:hypothetical protein KIN20_033456 [Parelaphostrongylus tenuis]
MDSEDDTNGLFLHAIGKYGSVAGIRSSHLTINGTTGDTDDRRDVRSRMCSLSQGLEYWDADGMLGYKVSITASRPSAQQKHEFHARKIVLPFFEIGKGMLIELFASRQTVNGESTENYSGSCP